MNEEETKKGIKKKINDDVLKKIIIGLSVFVVALLIFSAGMFVGGARARFSYQWAENYHKNFAGPKEGFLGDWQKRPPTPENFIEGHGVFGEIIELKEDGFVVNGRDNMEKIVISNKNTVIKKGSENSEEALKVGDRVVIIGSPNKTGQIEAKLIRIFDEGEMKKIEKPSQLPPLK